MNDRPPPLLNSPRLAMSLGAAIVGTLGFLGAARTFGPMWGLAGGIVGAIAGVVWSFDALIPGPPREVVRDSSSSGMRVGPFGGAVHFAAAALAALAAGAYVTGSHAIYLERAPNGQVDLVRDESWWLWQHRTLEREPDVRRVDDSRGSELLFHREEDQQHLSFVSDCPPGTAARVAEFLTDSQEPRFDLPRRNWAMWAAPLGYVTALACGWLAQRSLRRGIADYRKLLLARRGLAG